MKTIVLALFAVIGCTMCVVAIQPALAQQIDVRPSADALYADVVDMVLIGFEPGAEVEVRAERSMTFGGASPQMFRSSARFIADETGKLDIGATAPISGSYTSIDPMGLFWSMAPASEKAIVDRYAEIRLTAYVNGKLAASKTVTINGWLPTVQLTEVKVFPGAVFASLPGTERRPALILLHGSDGGSGTVRVMAQMFASRGYAVLGLPYYSPPDQDGHREIEALPAAFAYIPIDRLEQARDWLAQQPNVDADHIGLWGYSKGAEFALVAAAHFPWIKAVVASAPSDVVWEGWGPDYIPGTKAGFSYRGQSLPFVPYGSGCSGIYDCIASGRRAHPELAAAARIRVEDFKGDLLVAGAGKDTTWDSAHMAQAIAERRAEAGLKTTLLIFPDVDHDMTGDPWTPKWYMENGEAVSQAQRTMWNQTFKFFNRTLKTEK
ncbi:MAG: acyl-CoA thioester hydrolase/BAAT C-terminal domain-containing protein [Asticcacaulis sp.]